MQYKVIESGGYTHRIVEVDGLLLYLNPRAPRSDTPMLDNTTKKMAYALANPEIVKGVASHYRENPAQAILQLGHSTRGMHLCFCGAVSSNVDYLLPNGYATNRLAAHYLAWHRDSIPEDEFQAAADMDIELPEEDEAFEQLIKAMIQ